jgi:hypothetical protein
MYFSYYNHFVPYADRYIITISYHMQIDTLLQFRTICRSTHHDHLRTIEIKNVNFLNKYDILCIISMILYVFNYMY